MSDNNVYVVKNTTRAQNRDPATGLPTGVVDEYVTSSVGRGVSRATPVGFSKDFAVKIAEHLGMDPEKSVMLAEDNMVVKLHESARKLPSGEAVPLAQLRGGLVEM